LSPVAVIVSATFWTWLWGPIGLILATPLTMCLVVLGRHVDQLKFLEVMFGDEPPLTPVELTYQRMLALAAAAFGRVGGIDGAGALGAAGAEQGFVPFDLDQMVALQRLAAGAVARLGADGIALAVRPAITEIDQILPLGGFLSRHRCRRRDGALHHRAVGALGALRPLVVAAPGQQQNAPQDQQQTGISHPVFH
jgi:hypothetical protein